MMLVNSATSCSMAGPTTVILPHCACLWQARNDAGVCTFVSCKTESASRTILGGWNRQPGVEPISLFLCFEARERPAAY